MSADHLFIGAGSLAFISNFKQAGGFPPNGIATIAGTAVLAFLAAATKETAIAPAVSAFAALVLLVAVFQYVPGLTKKGK
ncbi:MAG TPA: hypothetical protein VN039_01675 [Nitrospira sp.]|nr:hypothetical protein [Nitrospira sp.]